MSDTKYLVAARKYRPQIFSDVVAQQHVTETLRNAIQMDRLGHAYLFSGPRGVGKTTVARILAKAINCETPLEERDRGEPCEKCSSCTTFNQGRSLNIIEIDAASNNRVDDIRELRDTVRIPPQGAKKKVYIVDEVHMLSTSAFNAFLKTLEEPPPYALFIFATTEPQKVIPTILSRCQRFDFKRIPVAQIVERLRDISDEEGITADDASLMLIAQKGDGALRDSLSVFDQAVSLCGSNLEYQELARALRVVDQDLYFDATQNASKANSAGMLNLVERITSEGYDLREFLQGLSGHLRNLLVAVSTSSGDLIEATDEVRKRYVGHAKGFSESQLLRLLMIASQSEESVGRSSQPRLAAELGLLKMAASMNSVDLREALDRLKSLEKSVSTSAPVQTSPAPIQPTTSKRPEPKADPPTPPAPLSDETVASEKSAEKMQVSEPEETAAPTRPASTPGQADVVIDTTPSESPVAPGLFGPPAIKKKTTPKNNQSNPAPVEGSLAVSTAPGRVPDSIEAIWLKYVSTVKSLRIHVGSLLQHGAPVDIKGSAVIVAVPDDFHKRLLDNQQEFLLKHLNAASEVQYKRLEFVIRSVERSKTNEAEKEEFDPYEYMKRKRQESPIVKSIFEDFGGELVW